MTVALVRIDDRLIHGQVVEGWIPYLGAEEVLVVSNAAVADDTQAALMRLALPESVGLEVLSVEQAARHSGLAVGYPRRVLVLSPGPGEVLGLLERGVSIARVNVGGLHYTAGRVHLGKAVFLSEEDRRALREISRRGAKLEGRALPSDREMDLLEMIGGPESQP